MNEQESPTSPQSDHQPDQSLGATIKRLGPAAYLGIAWSITPAIAGFVLLANMKPASDFLLQKNQEGGGSLAIGLAMYIGIFIVSAGFGFLPTYSQAILAGFAFGITMGFPAALIGFTGASIIGYIIAKIVARKSVESELHNHPKAEIVRDAFVKHGYWRAMGILILLRISPASPFSLMNGLMSVSGVKLLPYVMATAIGMAPRTFAAVWIGNQITNWDEYNKPKWLVIAGIVLMVVVIMILGQMANKAIDKAMGTNPAANPSASPDDTQPDSTSNPAG